MIRQLTLADLPDILDVEQRSFVPGARASEETLRRRLQSGHTVLGAENSSGLIGQVSFLSAEFDPLNQAAFPQSQMELSLQPNKPGANAGFIYNLATAPGYRGLSLVRKLYRAATEAIVASECEFVVGAVRMPSYRGSQAGPTENIPMSPVFSAAVDRYLAGGRLPSLREFCHDPLLAFHHRMSGGDFVWILPGFEPNDAASGGMYTVLVASAPEMLDRLGHSRK